MIPDSEFPYKMLMGIFHRIKQASDERGRLVLILPRPEPDYAWLAYTLNKFRVNCRNLHTFNMDEYAVQDGNIAPETWPNSFLYNMRKNYYSKLDPPALRPPEDQILGPTNANFGHYGKTIDDLGGADVCYGGIGWSGHIAYIEPGSAAFAAPNLEEWKKIGPRIVELTPFSILQNCLGSEFGQSGDWSAIPPKEATIGPVQIVGAKLRSSWNSFMVGRSMVSWQRFTVRQAAHGPVTPLVPASIIQMVPSELYLSETLAADIKPISVEEFTWY